MSLEDADEVGSRVYGCYGMPLRGKTTGELILRDLEGRAVPQKRDSIVKRVSAYHLANGGLPMREGQMVGAVKKALKGLLLQGAINQDEPGWYYMGTRGHGYVENEVTLIATPESSEKAVDLPSLLNMVNLNESQTQRSIIEPVLSRFLNWDVADHTRVQVEKALDADIFTNFVDYCLDHDGDGKYEILIEAKRLDSPLSTAEVDQLLRYMAISMARIGILTNGRSWMFFERDSSANSPLLDFDIEELRADSNLQAGFKLLGYDSWNIEKFIPWARKTSPQRAIAATIESEIFANPSNELIELMLRKARPHEPLSKRKIDRTRLDFIQVVQSRILSTRNTEALEDEIQMSQNDQSDDSFAI